MRALPDDRLNHLRKLGLSSQLAVSELYEDCQQCRLGIEARPEVLTAYYNRWRLAQMGQVPRGGKSSPPMENLADVCCELCPRIQSRCSGPFCGPRREGERPNIQANPKSTRL